MIVFIEILKCLIFYVGKGFMLKKQLFILTLTKEGRKKMHIKRFYPKDERFFRVLSIYGNIKIEDANKIDISVSRLKNMEKDKLIERVSYPSRYNKQSESNKCYALTKKGKEFIAQKYGMNRCQGSHAAEHNCKVAETICNLDKKEIDSIQSEWEIREQMVETLDQMRQEGDYDSIVNSWCNCIWSSYKHMEYNYC